MRIQRSPLRFPRRPSTGFLPGRACFLPGVLASALGVVLLVSGCGGPATPQEVGSAAGEAPDTLALLELHLATGVLDSVMAAEGNRLDLACPSEGAECRRGHVPDRVVPLDILRAHPSASAPATGILTARVHAPDHGPLTADLVYVGVGPDGPATPVHLHSLGDWGYGIHVAVRQWTEVVRQKGKTSRWVRISGAGSVEGSWLAVGRGGLQGWITPASEAVWTLDEETRTETGVPFERGRILRIEDGWVTLRAEVPSDMPCGIETPPDPGEPAVARLPLSGLFTTSGTPRIQTAYPRGC